jgi:transcriptional regulator with XRE-family HTH domain
MKATTLFSPNKKLLFAVATVIKTQRKTKKMTIEQLSEACGLHSKYVQTIEKGTRNISISVLVQIANALEIKPTLLLAKALKAV